LLSFILMFRMYIYMVYLLFYSINGLGCLFIFCFLVVRDLILLFALVFIYTQTKIIKLMIKNYWILLYFYNLIYQQIKLSFFYLIFYNFIRVFLFFGFRALFRCFKCSFFQNVVLRILISIKKLIITTFLIKTNS